MQRTEAGQHSCNSLDFSVVLFSLIWENNLHLKLPFILLNFQNIQLEVRYCSRSRSMAARREIGFGLLRAGGVTAAPSEPSGYYIWQ